MRRLAGLLAVILVACQGERVDNDAHAPGDGAVADTAAAETGAPTDTAPVGGCGGHRAGTTTMVNVGGYCIDEHEVTNGQWKSFANDSTGTTFAPAQCDWNTSPPATNPDPTTDAYARGNVNLCDAKTYCAWAGKRLCGRIGGGMNAKHDFADVTKSQWYRACSGSAPWKYPYGNAYDEAKCATGNTGGIPVRPKSYTSCRGIAPPYDAVFDMSGSMDEWEDSCASEGATGDTLCRGRGGALGDHAAASCDVARESAARSRFDGLGFRCCKDL